MSNEHKHPNGIWYLALIYTFYTFGFGTLNVLLVLFLRRSLNFTPEHAYGLFAAFSALVWTFPLLGGYLSGKFGYKQTGAVGLLFSFIGQGILFIHNPHALYIGLGAYVMGYGLCTPAIFSMVGLCYAKEDKRRQSGYTWFYLLFNFGFLISTAAAGFVSRQIGDFETLFLAGAAALISLAILIVFKDKIQPHVGRSMSPQIHVSNITGFAILAGICIVGTPVCMWLFENIDINNIVMWVLTIGSFLGVLLLAFKQKEKATRMRLFAYLMLGTFIICFFALYNLEPSLLTVFIQHNVNRTVGGLTIPAASYWSLDSVFVIILGVIFSIAWRKLSEINRNPSLPTKFTMGLFAMGFAFWLLTLATNYFATPKLASHWIVFAYALLSTGELLIVPIGFSLAGRLAPVGQEGLLMGIWQLFQGFAGVTTGYLADLAAVPKHLSPALSNPVYSRAFFEIGAISIALGIVGIFFIPMIKRLIHSN